MPELNYARRGAAACLLAGRVYVFAGLGDSGYLNSIENIKAASLVPNRTTSWAIIKLQENTLKRIDPAIAPLSDFEIVILGGYDRGDHLKI